jgi:molecular chaperone HtpG
MFKKDRADFESKWNDLKIFVEYGMLSEEKFAEKGEKFALLQSTDGAFATVEEYIEKIKPLQTDKNNKVVILYTNDKEGQFSFVKSAKERGYDVLEMNSPLTPHFISKLEQMHSDVSFARVDSDSLDSLIQKEEELPSKLSKEQEESIKPVFEETVEKGKFTVQFQSMSEKDSPIIITQPEFIRRMIEQQKMGGGGFFGAFPESYNLVVNTNHAKIVALVEMTDADAKSSAAKQLTDLALLSQGMLKGEALDQFIARSIELI